MSLHCSATRNVSALFILVVRSTSTSGLWEVCTERIDTLAVYSDLPKWQTIYVIVSYIIEYCVAHNSWYDKHISILQTLWRPKNYIHGSAIFIGRIVLPNFKEGARPRWRWPDWPNSCRHGVSDGLYILVSIYPCVSKQLLFYFPRS